MRLSPTPGPAPARRSPLHAWFRRCSFRAGLWLLVGFWLAIAPPARAADPPNYHFRQPPGQTVVVPAQNLLDAQELAFLAQLPEVRVGLNLPDNRPYEVVGPDGEVSGIQIEILTHLAQSLGLRLRPVVLPSFVETLQALRDKRIDVMATLGYDASREPYVAFTLGTAPNPGAVIGRAADRGFEARPTLNGSRVGIEAGYVAQQFVRRNYPEALIVEQPDTASALRAVAVGDVDYYVGSLLMAMDRAQRDAVPGLAVKRSLSYATGQMHFGVRKDWQPLASALSKGIATLRAAPLPALQSALQGLPGADQAELPLPMPLSVAEQRQLTGRTVLRIGAVRGLTLLNEATPGGGHAGIASDYTARVVSRLGVAADIVPFDSVAAMLDALRDGQIQLVPLLTRTPARARDMVFSAPYLEMPYYIVARSDAPLYWGLDSLRGKRLALTAQHPLREFLARSYADIQVVEAPPGVGAMELVARGQADAAVEVKLYANLRINNDNNGLLRTVAQVDELPAQFHFAASREAAGLIPLVDRALAEISPDERARMMRRWVAIDLEPGLPWRRYLPALLAVAAGLLLLAVVSAWWMRRLAKEVRSRRDAEGRLNDVANSLPGVVFQYVHGPDGQLEQAYQSGTADAFLGPGTSALPSLFEAVARHTPEAEAQALRRARARAMAERAPFSATAPYDDPRHGRRWLHCQAAVRALPGERTAWTGYLVDVSGERALQSQLLDAMQTKNLFVASASHELRGPLQVVALALQRLGERPLDAVQQQMRGIAQDSTAALAQLVDDVLDLAHLETGRMALRPAPVDLHALMRLVVDNHRLLAEARGLRLSLELAPGLPQHLALDALRLRQLLVNLISNAVKYTVQGGVTVSVRREPAAAGMAGPQRLVLQVRDTGIGIPPERQHALFEPFGTAHAPHETPDVNSTGLGLAICKRLVQAMQGEITLDSAPGRGTRVTVDLPMPPAAEALPVSAPALAHAGGTAGAGGAGLAGGAVGVDGPDGAGALVLLVDDDVVSRLLMGELLRQFGFVVVEATDTASAYARWLQGGVAMVMSDHQMPGGNGLGLLQRIRREAPPGQQPRLVLCSGSRLALDPATDGLDAVLHKPISVDQLTATLRQLWAPAPSH